VNVRKFIAQKDEIIAQKDRAIVQRDIELAKKDALISKLEKENKELKANYNQLKFRLEQLEKLLFGSKREKFIPSSDNSNQPTLFDETIMGEQAPKSPNEEAKQNINYNRKKPKRKHKGRNEFPRNLPEETIIIKPQGDISGMIKIGELVTKEVDYTPARLVIKKTVRPKYAKPKGKGIVVAKIPPRPFPKCIASTGLLAHILESKFVYHQPFYRIIQSFERKNDWKLSPSTLNNWFVSVCVLMQPLYENFMKKILAQGYVQIDESPIRVLDKNKKLASHKGYMWVYYSPEIKLVFFQYRKGRGIDGPKEMLKEYKGYIHSDGYKVYDKIGLMPGISLIGCLVHARRKFIEAMNEDKERAERAITIFRGIYLHERKSKQSEDRKAYRKKHVLPLMEELKEWMDTEQYKVLPKSAIGKAISYTINQWPKLIRILEHSRLELDNNLIENKIRPLALGRKNYLFAGSHKGAERIAMMYSFMGSCVANNVKPFEWLKETMENLPETKMTELDTLLPIKR